MFYAIFNVVISEKKIKKILLAFILVLVSSGLLFFLVNRPEKDKKPPPELKTTEADVMIEKFHLSQTDKDRVKWELKADTAEIYREEKKAVLKNIELTFKRSEGALAGDNIVLKAEEGILNTETRDILLKGKSRDIEVTTDKGYTFTVASLRWDEAKRQILSDDDVTLIGPNIRVEGKGILVHVDIEQIEVLSNVRTVVKNKKG